MQQLHLLKLELLHPLGLERQRALKSSLRDEGARHVQQTLRGKNVVKQAGGPIHSKSDGTKLSRGNAPAREQAVDFHKKEALKKSAVSEHIDLQRYGPTAKSL